MALPARRRPLAGPIAARLRSKAGREDPPRRLRGLRLAPRRPAPPGFPFAPQDPLNLRTRAAAAAAAPPRPQANDKDYSDDARRHLVFPPCGVVPFRGIAMYAAPLCYLYSDAPQLYMVLRALYAGHCCRLNTVSSGPGGALHLARQFEHALAQQPHLDHGGSCQRK